MPFVTAQVKLQAHVTSRDAASPMCLQFYLRSDDGQRSISVLKLIPDTG